MVPGKNTKGAERAGPCLLKIVIGMVEMLSRLSSVIFGQQRELMVHTGFEGEGVFSDNYPEREALR